MKKGFTLIEMLGIIAVLAVVLLVTFPVMNKSLKKMKEDQNENFLKNLKISAEAYIELNRKNYPELDNSGSATITIEDLYNAELLKGNYQVNTSNQIIITKKEDNTLEYYYVDPTKTIVYNFDYTGAAQEFNALQDGLYKIETWGAQGGSTPNSDKAGASTIRGGFGGYSIGTIELNQNENLYVFVGQEGPTINSSDIPQTLYAYPNGGAITSRQNSNGIYYNGGGGSTHIAKENKLIQELSPTSSNLLIVSGGGGGISNWWNYDSNGGSGGGYIGGSTTNNFFYNSTGGTQTEGGYAGGNQDGHARIGEWLAGKYGQGGGTLTYDATSYLSGGGGGGYYGGGASWGGSGAGGSGYIGNTLLTNKAMYCYDCEESNEVSTFTVSTTGTSSLKDTTNCPNGYSESPVAKCAKAGNGYARITYLGSAM